MTDAADGKRELSGVESPPLSFGRAMWALVQCALTTVWLLATGRTRLPTGNVGRVLHFADGSSARVYRETLVRREPTAEPVALIVEFRLRWVHGWGHAWFRAESLLNTPLFVGFPGFVSKLWLAHNEHGAYRGVYEWDGAARAVAYVRALWWPLALVCDRSTIHAVVVPALRRDAMLRDPDTLERPTASRDWWRVTRVDPAADG